MKKIILFITLVSTLSAVSQNPEFKAIAINTINVVADDFIGYDQFDFYYYIKDNALYKTKGTTSLEYKNPSFGKITKVDIKNPLNIVLFYENFNVVILLDNQLNETQKNKFFRKHERLGGISNWNCLAKSALGLQQFKSTDWSF